MDIIESVTNGPIDLGTSSPETVVSTVIAVAAKRAEERDSLFYREGALVEVCTDRVVALDNRNQFANWCVFNGVKIQETKVTKDGPQTKTGLTLPLELSGIAISRPQEWAGVLRPLDSISGVPYFLPNGGMITTPGYVEEYRLYGTADMPDVDVEDWTPDESTPLDVMAKWALQWLYDEIFVDFPFLTPADRANALGAIIALLTFYIHGTPLPMWIITALESGTGKGYLSEVIRRIISALALPTVGLPDREEEIGKTVAAILSATSQPVIAWDNVERGSQITSPTLCRLHTSKRMQTRTLGRTSIPVGVNDRLWIADGNNIGPGEDMVRRSVVVRLDAGRKDPALSGREYRHPDLLGWIDENRSTILGVLRTLYSCWDKAGRPAPRFAPSVSTYDPMIQTVGGILEFAGEVNFWGNLDDVREAAHDGTDDQVAYDFLNWIRTHPKINEDQFTASDIVDAVLEESGSVTFNLSDIEAPLPGVVVRKWNEGVTERSKAITRYLGNIKGQRFGTLQHVRAERLDVKTGNKTHFGIYLEVVGDRPEVR